MRILTSFILGLVFNYSFGQVDTLKTDTTKSVYKELKTIKLDSKSDINKVMVSCRPCILLKYDNADRLVQKSIQYTDCPVGYFIKYFPNGKVKIVGHYKENPSTSWNNTSDQDYCKPDGAWTYFSESGKELYSEYWKAGKFIKQVPEQTKSEIWSYSLLVNGAETEKQTFTFQEIKDLKIVPKFKNKSTSWANISIGIDVSAIGHIRVKKEFTVDNFHQLDILKLLDESGFKSTESISCTIMTYDNNVNIFNKFIKVEK
jgi:hypothetical protein